MSKKSIKNKRVKRNNINTFKNNNKEKIVYTTEVKNIEKPKILKPINDAPMGKLQLVKAPWGQDIYAYVVNTILDDGKHAKYAMVSNYIKSISIGNGKSYNYRNTFSVFRIA